MTMKSLISAAHAAGYAMAPTEELFHAGDEIVFEPIKPEAVFHAPVPVRSKTVRPPIAESWWTTVLSGMLARRATAA